MGKIDIDLRRANQQADELERISKRLKQISDRNLGTTINSISGSWESSNSDKFCRKGHMVMNNINSSARQLQNIAANIRVVAKRTYDAEKQAQEIALKREYKS